MMKRKSDSEGEAENVGLFVCVYMYYLSAPLFPVSSISELCDVSFAAVWEECFDRRSSALSEKGIILRKELEQEQSPGDRQLVYVYYKQRKNM